MKLKDLSIGTQLRIGLGGILVFVVLLGGLAWLQTGQLWQQTRGLYEHPLTVRRALGDLQADILAIRGGMKDLCLAENDQERQTLLQGIDVKNADAIRQFDIVFDSYLGPRSDIEAAFQGFVQWKALRSETIRLLREGKVAEAIRRTKETGVAGSHAHKVLANLGKISDFAKTGVTGSTKTPPDSMMPSECGLVSWRASFSSCPWLSAISC